MDNRSIFLWITSSMTTILGLITLSQIAIGVGILAGISTIASSAVNMYFKIKQNKKNNVNRSGK